MFGVIALCAELVERFCNGLVHVFREVLGIRSWVGGELESVVEILSNTKGSFCRPGPHAVGTLLQGGEVKVEGRLFLLDSALLLGRESALGSQHGFDGLLLVRIHDAVCFVLRAIGIIFVSGSLPASRPACVPCGERGVELPVWDGNVGQHLEFMVNDQGEGCGLHSAERIGRTVTILGEPCCDS